MGEGSFPCISTFFFPRPPSLFSLTCKENNDTHLCRQVRKLIALRMERGRGLRWVPGKRSRTSLLWLFTSSRRRTPF